MSLDIEIVKLYLRYPVLIISGFNSEEYGGYVRRFSGKEEFNDELPKLRYDISFSYDFLELQKLTLKEANLKVKVANLFLYNVDLFGEDSNPESGTAILRFMRGKYYENISNSQLMFVKPGGDLNYTIRSDKYLNNHPLGNWPFFAEIKDNIIIPRMMPP